MINSYYYYRQNIINYISLINKFINTLNALLNFDKFILANNY